MKMKIKNRNMEVERLENNENCYKPKNISNYKIKTKAKKASKPQSPRSSQKEDMLDKYNSLKSEFKKSMIISDYSKCLEISTELFGISKIITEIYNGDEKVYYESYLNLIKSYRKKENYQTAEKHLLKLKIEMKKIMTNTMQSNNNNDLYFFYILSLKELLLLYRDQGMYDFVIKFNDLLEEENLEFLGVEDKLELDLARAELMFEKDNLEDAVFVLENNKGLLQKNLELVEKKLISHYFICLSKYYRVSKNFETAIDYLSQALEILFDIDNTNNVIKCTIIRIFLDKIFIFKKIQNSEEVLMEEYQNLSKIIFLYLQNTDFLIDNEKLFLTPLKKYINYLVKIENYEEAINISEKLYILLEKCFGLFHKHVAVNFRNRGNIYIKLREKKKSINCFKMAIEIALQINEKNMANQLKRRVNLL